MMAELGRIVEGAKGGSSNGQSRHQIVLINLHNNAMKVQERLHATLGHWQVKMDFLNEKLLGTV